MTEFEAIMDRGDLNNNERKILKFRIKKDGPYEFALDVVDNRLIVIDIFPGGIIHRHGGVLVDDELLELDGVKLNPDDFYDCVHKLEIVLEDKTHKCFELTVARSVSKPEEPDEEMYN